jgi:hypothetical protein
VILLGVNAERKFLLQNWWKKSQFIECSERHLEELECGSEALFMKSISLISTSLPRMDVVYAKAADVDHKEAYYPEDF